MENNDFKLVSNKSRQNKNSFTKKETEKTSKFNEQLNFWYEKVYQEACLSESDVQKHLRNKNYNNFLVFVNYDNNLLENVDNKSIFKDKILSSEKFMKNVKKYYRDLGCSGVSLYFVENKPSLKIVVYKQSKETENKSKSVETKFEESSQVSEIKVPVLNGAWANSLVVNALKTEVDKPFVDKSPIVKNIVVSKVEKNVKTNVNNYTDRYDYHFDRLLKTACLSENKLLEEYNKGEKTVVLTMDLENDIIEQVNDKQILKSKILNSKNFKELLIKYYKKLGCAKVILRRIEKDFNIIIHTEKQEKTRVHNKENDQVKTNKEDIVFLNTFDMLNEENL